MRTYSDPVKRARSRYYVVRVYDGGRRSWKSTKMTNLLDAKRVVRKWITQDAEGIIPGCDQVTVEQIVREFLRYANDYYRDPTGEPTGTHKNLSCALNTLREVYGDMPAMEFRPKRLRELRERLIAEGLSRNYVNQTVVKIRQMFRWAVAADMIPPSTLHALLAVEGLRRGRTKARESAPVKPVLQRHVDAIEPYVSSQVWAMVRLQLLTGARSGEVVIMRPGDIQRKRRVWEYQPGQHKTAHHGRTRTIYIGPQGQAVLRPFLRRRSPWAYMFSPQEAEVERLRRRRAFTDTRTLKSSYSPRTYRQAIQRACKKAKVPRWHPHQLRHNAATHLRKEFGIETARIILGHTSPAMTAIYAEADRERAIKVMGEIG